MEGAVAEDDETAVLDFAQQRQLAGEGGWLQGRYHGEGGMKVREALSYEAVFGVCPFAVGSVPRGARGAHAARLAHWVPRLELQDLLARPFTALSNGEMRRVLLARAILRAPRRLVLNDPMAGLDPVRRQRFKAVVAELREGGMQVDLLCRNRDERLDGSEGALPEASPPSGPSRAVRIGPASDRRREPVVELNGVTVRLGRRTLFENLDWTVRRGERWVLGGPNGSGKTTLLALVSGDSPLAYANDVRVFGVPRKPGYELAQVRRRMAAVSPEMQTYSGRGAEDLLAEALASEPELLLLDEPCLNLDAAAARQLVRRVSAWLKARPSASAVVVAHRRDHVPSGFARELRLVPGGEGVR